MKIKNITSPDFKNKLNSIIIKSNRISKYRKELKNLYGEKINRDKKDHMKILFDIWYQYYPNDRDIKYIDQKWRKEILHNILI